MAIEPSTSQLNDIINSVDAAGNQPKADGENVFPIVPTDRIMGDWTVESIQMSNDSPTGSSPAVTSWAGVCNFKANFMRMSNNPKHETWEVGQ